MLAEEEQTLPHQLAAPPASTDGVRERLTTSANVRRATEARAAKSAYVLQLSAMNKESARWCLAHRAWKLSALVTMVLVGKPALIIFHVSA